MSYIYQDYYCKVCNYGFSISDSENEDFINNKMAGVEYKIKHCPCCGEKIIERDGKKYKMGS